MSIGVVRHVLVTTKGGAERDPGVWPHNSHYLHVHRRALGFVVIVKCKARPYLTILLFAIK